MAAAGALLVGLLKPPVDAGAQGRLEALDPSQLTLGQIERALGGPTTMRSIMSLRKPVAKHCVQLGAGH